MKSYAFKMPPIQGSRRIEMEQFEKTPFEIGGISAVGQLESRVSMLQIARSSLKRMRDELGEMQDFLSESLKDSAAMPTSLVENLLSGKLMKLKALSESASFQGQTLLNGRSGVTGIVRGDGIRFVRGSAQAQNSGVQGYTVSIEEEPKAASLLGREPISEDSLAKESMLVLAEGNREVRFRIERGMDSSSLIEGLQRSLWKGGIEVSVYLTPDGRLAFLHNRAGRKARFQGMSLKTRLISHQPGNYSTSQVGQDVAGRIGGEPATCEGGFLYGAGERTKGIQLYYEGKIAHPGQIVGYVEILQKGVLVPLDATGQRQERLSLPALGPNYLSIGLGNRSGFTSLEETTASSLIERLDSLRLIEEAIRESNQLSDELKQKEDAYVQLAIHLLKEGAGPREANQDLLIEKDKAQKMAQELAGMM